MQIVYDFSKQLTELINPAAIVLYKQAIDLHKRGIELRGSKREQLFQDSSISMRRSAELGYPPAKLNMAISILQEREPMRHRLQEAFKLMMDVARLPVDTADIDTLHMIIRAQIEVSNMYLKGLGTQINTFVDLEWAEQVMKTSDRINQIKMYPTNIANRAQRDRAQTLIEQAQSSCPRAFPANQIF